jgi:WD40 repeat protein
MLPLLLLLPAFAGPVPVKPSLPEGAIARLGTPNFRHGGVIRSLAFSPNGKQLASASHDGSISVWAVPSGHEVLRLLGHEADVTCVVWLDGKHIASGSSDGTVRIWATTGKIAGHTLHKLTFTTDAVLSLALSPSGKLLAVGCDDGNVHLVDTTTRKSRHMLEHDRAATALAWSPDGKRLAVSGGSAKTLTLWDDNGKRIRKFGTKLTTALAFSRDGKILAAWEPGDVIRTYDPASGNELKSWRARTGADADGPDAVCYQLTFLDGGRLFAGSSTGTASVWDASSGKLKGSLKGHICRVSALAASRDYLATAGDNAIRLWNAKTYRALRDEPALAEPLVGLSASADGKLLALTTQSGRVLLWDRKTGKVVPRLKGQSEAVLTPDGKGIFALSLDGKLVRYNGGKGKPIDAPYARYVALSRDGKRLATAHAGVVILRKPDGKSVAGAPVSAKRTVTALSDDGSRAAGLTGAASVPVWDGGTGKKLITLKGHPGGTLSAAFSADACVLFTGGRDRLLRFWDLDTGKERYTGRGQLSSITSIATSPDGNLVACATANGLVQVRGARGGMLLAEFRGHRGPVKGLAFLGNGSLASAGSDSLVHVWDTTALSKGKRKLFPLTAEQRAQLWAVLRSEAPAKASAATEQLALGGEAVLAHIRRDVKPVDAALFARLLKDLDADVFETREKAMAGMKARGRAYENMLRKELKGKPSLEVYRSIEKLLAELPEAVEGDHLRELRAIELLELLGTDEAKKILKTLASGAPDAELTQRAKAALARLTRRSP